MAGAGKAAGKILGDAVKDAVIKKGTEIAVDKVNSTMDKYSQKKDNTLYENEKRLRERIAPELKKEKIKSTSQTINNTNIINNNGTQSNSKGNPVNDNQNNMSAEEAEERAEQIREEKARLNEEKKQKIEELKAKIEQKKSEIKAGPKGLLKFFSSYSALSFIGTIDALWSIIPIVGQIFGFVSQVIFWTIPAIMLGNFSIVIKAIMVQIVDTIIGLILDTVEVLTLGTGLGISVLADFATEFVLIKFSPSEAIIEAYEESIPSKIAELDEEFEERKLAIEKDYSYKKKGFISKYFGGSEKSRKIMSMLAFMGIAAFGPFGTGYLAMGEGASYIPIIFLVIFLSVISLIGVIEKKDVYALLIFLVINLFFIDIMKIINDLDLFGNNAFIGPIIFIVFMLMFVAKIQFDINNAKFIGMLLIVLLLFSTPFMFAYLSSDYFTERAQESFMTTKVELDNMNIWEKAVLWFEYQTKLGKGEIIAGAEMESTQQHIGVEIAGVGGVTKDFRLGDEVKTQIYYKTGAYFPLNVYTTCKVGTTVGEIPTNQNVKLGAGFSETFVECYLKDLKKGSHKVDFTTVYPYTSTVDIPLKIMSKEFADHITSTSFVENKVDLEEFVGGTQKARTDAGPVVIGVSNTMNNGKQVLKMPIVINKTSVEPLKLIFQLQPYLSAKDSQTLGKVARITGIKIDSPRGLEFKCSNIDDAKNIEVKEEGNRQILTVDGVNIKGSTYVDFNCELIVDKNYVNEFVPSTFFSMNTILVSISYDYSMESSTLVKVI